MFSSARRQCIASTSQRLEPDVKTFKKCYFSSAALATLFLLEAFLPIQLF
jgi:hypothetical protein